MIFTHFKVSVYFRFYLNLLFTLLFFFRLQFSFAQELDTTKLTIHVKNAKLKTVLKSIKDQTNYLYFVNDNLAQKALPITLDLTNATLKSVLDMCFSDQPLTYQIKGKTIFIIERKKSEIPLGGYYNGGLLIKVVDDHNLPLPNANIILKTSGSDSSLYSTDQDGAFSIYKVPKGEYEVKISFIGYDNYLKRINIQNGIYTINVKLTSSTTSLNEVVVNSGYQKLPKERATGSFDIIGEKIINRSVSSNIMDRIDGFASGVFSDPRSNLSAAPVPKGTSPNVNIRGISTINANAMPLVILDNFPFRGNINDINPNDVANITILKDAAAASIWGAQAGNGVIVITSKSGKYNQKPTISFNSSVSITTKPDLFSKRQISPSDFVDFSILAAKANPPDAQIETPIYYNYAAVTPIQMLVYQQSKGIITNVDFNNEINALKGNDIRHDLLRYFYKTPIAQQYSVSISGGGKDYKYQLSTGYDNEFHNEKSSANRNTFIFTNTYQPFKGLTISIPVHYSSAKEIAWGIPSDVINAAPYYKLADASGNALSIVNYDSKLESFNNQALSQGLYSYDYKPLNEYKLNSGPNSSRQLVNITPSLTWDIGKGVSANVQYSYDLTINNQRTDQSDSLQQVRYLINEYTQVDPSGNLSYPINKGHFLSLDNSTLKNQFFRAQVNYDHYIGKDHQLTLLAAYEKSESITSENQASYYGYDPNTDLIQNLVDYVTPFKQYDSDYTNTISNPTPRPLSDFFNAIDSKLANSAYTYKGKYTLSASGRIDRTNLFGQSTNKKQKILWSTGFGWKISEEPFYKIGWLTSLKLRATYGFQGNIPSNIAIGSSGSSSLSPLLTINNGYGQTLAGFNYATLATLPNSSLRWETVKQANLGLDFEFLDNKAAGSIDIYSKAGSDLIGQYFLNPTYGASQNTGNTASTITKGLDLVLNVKNISKLNFNWTTNYLFSFNNDRVTKYLVPTSLQNILTTITNSDFAIISPVEGNAVYGVYAFKSPGLDATGDPLGYGLDGKISKDYNAILNNTPVNQLRYYGSGRPTRFATILNNFSYKSFTATINIGYSGGYYFHVKSFNPFQIPNDLTQGVDWERRWQKPGDEKITKVPGLGDLSDPNDYLRFDFYQASTVLVQKGDNIRLRDMTFSYQLSNAVKRKLALSSLEIYANIVANKLLWKINNAGIDPENYNINPPKTYSLGLRTTF